MDKMRLIAFEKINRLTALHFTHFNITTSLKLGFVITTANALVLLRKQTPNINNYIPDIKILSEV